MNTDFKEIMASRTDEQLIKITTVEKEKYQPEAIAAAEIEMKIRNLDSTAINKIEKDLQEQVEKQKELDSKKVNIGIRLLHFVIDTIAWIILMLVLGFVLDVLVTFSSQAFFHFSEYLIMFISFVGYYIFMESNYQKTLAKFITKTKVVKNDGTKAKVVDIIIRTFCRFLPFDRISFLFSPNGFHDRLSNTMLIKDDNDLKTKE